MFYEWLWILLPLCVLLGWYANHWARHIQPHSVTPLKEFLQSLQLSANQAPDKEIDALIKLYEVVPETLETHVALGNVFRQRGEIDKATRIHNNVLKRLKPSDAEWATVSLELGRDYFKAGLLDRAEEIFKHLSESHDESARSEACRNLIRLYELEQIWNKAIIPAQTLMKEGDKKYATHVSHYYCELAEAENARDNINKAYDYLEMASAINKTLPRLMILEGDLKFVKGNSSSALALWTQSFVLNPGYSELLLPRIKKALDAENTPDFVDYMGGLHSVPSNTPYLYFYIRALIDAGRHDELYRLLRRWIKERKLPKFLIEAALTGFLQDSRLDYEAVSRSLDDAKDHIALYRCSYCGVESSEHNWYCRVCHNWDTVALHNSILSN